MNRLKNMSLHAHSGPDWSRELSAALRGAARLVVLGVGNPNKGDDAAGCLFVRGLQRELGRRERSARAGRRETERSGAQSKKFLLLEVLAFDAGEAPENSTGRIREFRPTHVLIVDAALGGFDPGTIFLIDREKISQDDISTHRIPLVYLVRYLEEDVGCRVILAGIEPKDLAWGKPVSSSVKAAAARLAAWLARL